MKLSDNARVTRTLIVSLVVALGVMVPLRFYQVGEELAYREADRDLQSKVSVAVALHKANMQKAEEKQREMALLFQEPAVLGAATIGSIGNGCMTAENANNLVASMYDTLESRGNDLTEEEVNAYIKQVDLLRSKLCK